VHVVRLFRNLGLEFQRVVRGTTDEHLKLRRRVATALLATAIVDLIGTGVMYTLEHGKRGSEIDSLFQGFFWVSAQLLTVSSQMKNPVTTGGRIMGPRPRVVGDQRGDGARRFVRRVPPEQIAVTRR
jgi:hypothetical protein